MATKIGIVNVNDFNSIPEAVVYAIKLIEKDLPFKFNNSKYILLKPNLLSANKNACTQPGFVEGVVDYLKNIGVSIEKIKIGDSPGQSQKDASYVARAIGLIDICERKGIEIIDFESELPVKETIDKALIMKEFLVSKPVKECDILINLPRLKTHIETTITGAIKNYYGIIPGGLKAKKHLMGKNVYEFGEVIADNFSWVVKNKPDRLTVYDLHTIMEGPKGPVAGNMVNWNLILTGTDELALDLVALEIGKFNGLKDVSHLNSVFKRGLGIGNLEDIEFVGMTLADAQKQTPELYVPAGLLTRIASYVTNNLVYKIMKKVPDLNKELCNKCGDCSQICPIEVIDFKEGEYPIFGRKDCASCLCCMETCPSHAIDIKMRGIGGLLDHF